MSIGRGQKNQNCELTDNFSQHDDKKSLDALVQTLNDQQIQAIPSTGKLEHNGLISTNSLKLARLVDAFEPSPPTISLNSSLFIGRALDDIQIVSKRSKLHKKLEAKFIAVIARNAEEITKMESLAELKLEYLLPDIRITHASSHQNSLLFAINQTRCKPNKGLRNRALLTYSGVLEATGEEEVAKACTLIVLTGRYSNFQISRFIRSAKRIHRLHKLFGSHVVRYPSFFNNELLAQLGNNSFEELMIVLSSNNKSLITIFDELALNAA